MATITITVDYNPNGDNQHKLHVWDSEQHDGATGGNNQDDITTEVTSGDTINWVIKPGSRVSKITSIAPKSGSVDFLNTVTCNSDGSATGTIKSGFHGGDMENYNIGFQLDGAPQQYIDDPKMKMKGSTT